jgi:hypothetical protein
MVQAELGGATDTGRTGHTSKDSDNRHEKLRLKNHSSRRHLKTETMWRFISGGKNVTRTSQKQCAVSDPGKHKQVEWSHVGGAYVLVGCLQFVLTEQCSYNHLACLRMR